MIRTITRNILNFIPGILFLAIVFLSLFVIPPSAKAGTNSSLYTIIDLPTTESISNRLIGYWDLRDRNTYFQVTNVFDGSVMVHIQLFNIDTHCAEFDYYDTFTSRDTHVYNVSKLDRNNGNPLAAPDLDGGHGIIAVSVSPQTQGSYVLSGNFRITDNSGYEYRTNMAGQGISKVSGADKFSINFNDIDNTISADLVVITYTTNNDSDTISPTLNLYQPTIYDQDENPVSCPPVLLGCYSNADQLSSFNGLTNHIDVGINQSITNSKGGTSLCLGNDNVGHLELKLNPLTSPPPDRQLIDIEEGAIFIGLNNSGKTGSIDHAESSHLVIPTPI